MLGIIKRNLKYLNSNSFVLLCKSMVRSLLDYCSSVWASYKNVILRWQKKYKKVIKLIPELKNMILSGKYDTAVTPRVMREHSYILGWRKVDQNTTCTNTFLPTGYLIFGTAYLTMLCDTVNKFKSYLDKFWQYQDNVYKASIKFSYKAEIHGTGSRSSVIGYQYFVSLVLVMRALACAHNSSTSRSSYCKGPTPRAINRSKMMSVLLATTPSFVFLKSRNLIVRRL